jgi:hypothetical protein
LATFAGPRRYVELAALSHPCDQGVRGGPNHVRRRRRKSQSHSAFDRHGMTPTTLIALLAGAVILGSLAVWSRRRPSPDATDWSIPASSMRRDRDAPVEPNPRGFAQHPTVTVVVEPPQRPIPDVHLAIDAAVVSADESREGAASAITITIDPREDAVPELDPTNASNARSSVVENPELTDARSSVQPGIHESQIFRTVGYLEKRSRQDPRESQTEACDPPAGVLVTDIEAAGGAAEPDGPEADSSEPAIAGNLQSAGPSSIDAERTVPAVIKEKTSDATTASAPEPDDCVQTRLDALTRQNTAAPEIESRENDSDAAIALAPQPEGWVHTAPDDLTRQNSATPKIESHEGEPVLDESSAADVIVDASADPLQSENEFASVSDAGAEPSSHSGVRRPTSHRDRRGSRRSPTAASGSTDMPRGRAKVTPAEAWLRLVIRPIQRTVRLTLVLGRGEGFPDRVTLAATGVTVHAYDKRRYDDADLPSDAVLIGDELRLTSVEEFRWLRSARRIQIFTTTPNEADLISVSAARAQTEHALLCQTADVAEVRRVAGLAGSPPLTLHDGWPGVPPGCAVLSGYRPTRAVEEEIDPWLSTLDPRAGIEIELRGGLAIRSKVFPEGHLPSIVIDALPDGATVLIGDERAEQSEAGSWVAPRWDHPGRHTIDVVPGPSLTYEVVADPAYSVGWSSWDAHPDRFGLSAASPWECAQICGAHVIAPDGNAIVAAQAQQTSVALGIRSAAISLRRRCDVPVSVAAVPEDVAFLLSTSGARRQQGHIVWLGYPALAYAPESVVSKLWADTIRSASSRRFPLVGADGIGVKAWRDAVLRARAFARHNK